MALKLIRMGLVVGSLSLALAADRIRAADESEYSPTPAEASQDTNVSGLTIPTDLSTPAASNAVAGELEVVRERYPEGKIRVERQVTLDSAGNYVNHGTWKLFSRQGDVLAEGQYNLGLRVGLWTRWLGYADAKMLSEFPFREFKAPFMSRANFAEGRMEGEWTISDANERKVMTVSLQAGERTGTTTIWLPNGTIYRQQTFDHAVPVGDVLEVNPKTGSVAKAATYEDGRKIVTKTEYYPRGRQLKSEVMYLAAKTVVESPDEFWSATLAKFTTEGTDLRHGSTKMWYANGQLQQEGVFDHGKKHGTFTYWYENGQVDATGEYRQDKAEGEWVWYHQNGQKSAFGRYEHGALIGDWRWWDEQGKLTKHDTYTGTESAASPPQERTDVSLRKADSRHER